jgi:hypothetical protein
MEEGKIIGFNLSLNFGFTNEEEHKDVISNIEDMIDYLLKGQIYTGAVLLNGKTEFIRENNDLGIRKL